MIYIKDIKTEINNSSYYHDYDYEWDYEYQEVSEKDSLFLDNILSLFKKHYLKETKYKCFKIANINLGKDVGVYISGTESYPCIGINFDAIKNFSINKKECMIEIFITILHELYHAEEELYEYEFEENYVENKARNITLKYINNII